MNKEKEFIDCVERIVGSKLPLWQKDLIKMHLRTKRKTNKIVKLSSRRRFRFFGKKIPNVVIDEIHEFKPSMLTEEEIKRCNESDREFPLIRNPKPYKLKDLKDDVYE